MATLDFAHNRSLLTSLRTTLALDAAFEFAAGVALLVFSTTIGGWLGIGTIASVGVGVVFLMAGAFIASMLRRQQPDLRMVRALAIANTIGGCAGWIFTIAAWTSLDPAGRAVLGTVSDAFLMIGVLELAAIRHAR